MIFKIVNNFISSKIFIMVIGYLFLGTLFYSSHGYGSNIYEYLAGLFGYKTYLIVVVYPTFIITGSSIYKEIIDYNWIY